VLDLDVIVWGVQVDLKTRVTVVARVTISSTTDSGLEHDLLRAVGLLTLDLALVSPANTEIRAPREALLVRGHQFSVSLGVVVLLSLVQVQDDVNHTSSSSRGSRGRLVPPRSVAFGRAAVKADEFVAQVDSAFVDGGAERLRVSAALRDAGEGVQGDLTAISNQTE